jgi:ABC-type Zn uptake system ZnuABC Zn-binding protein ZnuA
MRGRGCTLESGWLALNWISFRVLSLLMVLVFVAAGCGGGEQTPAIRTQFAITTSWLECALKDIAGAQTPVYRLCPPGTCPGHFDISPGGVEELARSRALVLFDFQRALDDKLNASLQQQVRVLPIDAPPGLCLPESYLSACRELSAALAAEDPSQAAHYETALTSTTARLARLETRLRAELAASGAGGAEVVASGHQAVFCRWLGLDVVAVYSGGEAATPAQLEDLIKAGRESGVRYVIGNLQEGRQAAEALAWQLGAPIVTFSNFPSMQPEQDTFDELLEHNVQQLIAGAAAVSAPADQATAR